MHRVAMIGKIGGGSNGGGNYLFARVDSIVREGAGSKYYITLIRPPRNLFGVTNAYLVGKIPEEIKLGDFVKVVHWQKDGFAFRARASFEEVRKATASDTLNGIKIAAEEKPLPEPQPSAKRTDTQPLLPMAQIARAQFIEMVSSTSPDLKVQEAFFEKGIYVKQHPPKILKTGQLITIPPKFISHSTAEDYEHGQRVSFIRLKGKLPGSNYELACTQAICERMEKLLQMMREGRFFTADLSEAKEIKGGELSSPLLKKLDPAKVLISKIVPEELRTELDYNLEVHCAQHRNEAYRGKIYFRLTLDREEEGTRIMSNYDPGKMTALDLMEIMVSLDFRALVIGSATKTNL